MHFRLYVDLPQSEVRYDFFSDAYIALYVAFVKDVILKMKILIWYGIILLGFYPVGNAFHAPAFYKFNCSAVIDVPQNELIKVSRN